MTRILKRLWGVRHLRYMWYAVQLARWVNLWGHAGALHASEQDLAYLDAVWKGEV